MYNIPCETGLLLLPNESINFVCIDPPYTDGVKDVLNGHKIQTKLDILAITKEHFRVLKPNSFYAVFGQMPTILAWYNAAIEVGFKYRQEFIWCKRTSGIGGNEFNRTHENIWIFSKGNAKYFKVEQKWDDIAKPMILDNLMNIETVFRLLSYWKGIAQGKKLIDGSKEKRNVNDDYYTNKNTCFDKIDNCKGSLSYETVNLSTIWSFLPFNRKHKHKGIKHPTVKSIDLLERLIELCTPEDTEITVLDSFVGSGTTAIACQNTKRNFIAFELFKEYVEITNNRLANNKTLFTQ